MLVEKTFIDGLLIIKPDVYFDERGFFFESFNQKRYFEAGIDFNFVQDNISKSKKGTIRGLHYQVGDFAQGKLCYVIAGKVLDVAVDIRFGSPTFGKYFSCELSEENKIQLWIPPGFAHGFSVLSDDTIFYYKCTALYSKEHERSILFNDEHLNIDWKVENPIVSKKDLAAKRFKDIDKDFFY
ncbi:dTDP-4-dehydrorhamnose 3,5-epimerase [Rosettibacter firmus]|uniref:dTDP-4-dehydrorhamnose 3,5-epimerase n=1 Tax=Rosettibacter firmus TaxID=3111522 RepID=UPI00336C2A9E